MTFRERWSRVVRKSGSTSTMASNDTSVSSSGRSFLGRTFGMRSSKTPSSTANTSLSSSSGRGLGSRGSSSTKGVRTLPGAVGAAASSSSSTSSSSGNRDIQHSIGSTIDAALGGRSKKCNKMPTLEDHHDESYVTDNETDFYDGGDLHYSNMTEAQRHQARLNAYRIKFGASRPWRGSFDEISPCNSRRASLDMGP
ncbi:hypothetical protein SPBR_06212 [Sporothrix brasiliensis 5110]|uniref:Uncharacterized protein n=1 Tax=Sporothrix brasiliensis 5110 TaxID=1398154 RepID=A0A0C2IZ67_9PEZI|nr:uncharacterized protein SPBR_06212 [Sporothrix brasiliensis 5110]KIH94406.1 hypothetical protein SPBR_06212 [Sporothrix brasiliensis 5110]